MNPCPSIVYNLCKTHIIYLIIIICEYVRWLCFTFNIVCVFHIRIFDPAIYAHTCVINNIHVWKLLHGYICSQRSELIWSMYITVFWCLYSIHNLYIIHAVTIWQAYLVLIRVEIIIRGWKSFNILLYILCIKLH